MTEHRHPREIAKEIHAKKVETFEAWAVYAEGRCVGHRVFTDEDEVDRYMAHLRDMSFTRTATVQRVRVTVERISE